MPVHVETQHFPEWIILKPAEDVPGTWVSRCLTIDVVSFGDSPEEAFRAAVDAAQTTMADDLNKGFNPLDRRAPDAEWRELARILGKGATVPLSTAFASGERGGAFAVPVLLSFGRAVHVTEPSDAYAEPACA